MSVGQMKDGCGVLAETLRVLVQPGARNGDAWRPAQRCRLLRAAQGAGDTHAAPTAPPLGAFEIVRVDHDERGPSPARGLRM